MTLIQWLFSRIGGTEPQKFHACIYGTLLSWEHKMCLFSSNLKCMYRTIYCINAQTDHAERDITNQKNAVNPNRRTPQARSNLC